MDVDQQRAGRKALTDLGRKTADLGVVGVVDRPRGVTLQRLGLGAVGVDLLAG